MDMSMDQVSGLLSALAGLGMGLVGAGAAWQAMRSRVEGYAVRIDALEEGLVRAAKRDERVDRKITNLRHAIGMLVALLRHGDDDVRSESLAEVSAILGSPSHRQHEESI
jgi:type IV secretory pathway TrbF-like protein